MKIQEYFDRQKQIKLTDIEKLNLYHDFLSKTQKNKSLTKRYLNFSKSFAYSFLIFVLLTSIFGIYFQKNSTIDFGNFGFSISHNNNWANTVQASYIAKVVEFQGDYHIENDGNTYRSSNIASNDNIILKKWAKLVFNINLGTQAIVVWPAKFSLIQDPVNKNTYFLTLKEWDYMEIKTLAKSKNQENIEVILPDNSKIKNNFKKIDFQLSKIDDEYAIKNNGEVLVVSQEESNKTQNLENKQVISFRDNDLVLIQDPKEFEFALQKMQISQTFPISDTLDSWDVISTGVVALVDEVDKTLNHLESTSGDVSLSQSWEILDDISSDQVEETWEIQNTDPNIVKKVDAEKGVAKSLPSQLDEKVVDELSIDQKIIPTEAQSETIGNVLNGSFLKKNLEKLSVAYLMWDQQWFDKQSNILQERFYKVSDSFDIKISTPVWENSDKIISISNNAVKFISQVQQNYFLPNKYTENTSLIKNRIDNLIQYTYWEYEQENVDEIVNRLSSQMIFQ